MCKKRIAFIGCSKTKAHKKTKVKNMYLGSLFKKAYKYCSLNFDEVWVLSAKYGLISINKEIEPYDITLNTFGIKQRKKWALKVKKQMIKNNLIDKIDNELFFFCGKRYHEFLEGNKPLKGLSLGNQLKWFNNNLKKKEKKGFLINENIN